MKIAAATVAGREDIILYRLIAGSINDVESVVVIVSFLRLYGTQAY